MSSQGGVSIARNRNGDRFYNPPAVRRHKQQQQMLQKQQQEQQIRKSSSSPSSTTTEKANWGGGGSVESEKRSERDDCASSSVAASEVGSGCSVSHDGVDCLTNLDRFLEYTTPFVPAQYFPKTSIKDWRNNGAEFHPYFVLGDLWESFKEWSAYGAGVPLLLNENDSVVQYYVPYLSGIQLYVDPSRPSTRLSNRRPGEYSDAESSREISSDGSSDCEAERGANVAINESWSKLNNTSADSLSYKRNLLKKEPTTASSSGELEIANPPGLLMFEYLERDSPFGREPLADKISVLASKFPELRTCRSCDLLSSSWISVAWYPIYRIPTGPTLQNLDACFLTFHSLSTSLKSTSSDFLHLHNSSMREVHSADSMKLSLPIFGLAFYKFKISVWNPSEVCQKANSLLLAAGNWLRLLQVNHPDYSFFVSHSSYVR